MHPAEEAPGYATQLWSLYGITAGVVLFVLTRAPWNHKFLALTGVLACALALTEARRRGPAPSAGTEPMAISILAAASQFVPVLFISFPFSRESAVAIFLIVLCAQGFWALYRYPARPGATFQRRSTVGADLREGVTAGLLFAAFFSFFATAIMLVVSVSEGTRAFVMLAWVVAGYTAGGVLAGAVAGVLRPATAFPLGLIGVGVLGGAAVYGSMMRVITVVDAEGSGMPLSAQVFGGLALGVIAGPAAALRFHHG